MRAEAIQWFTTFAFSVGFIAMGAIGGNYHDQLRQAEDKVATLEAKVTKLNDQLTSDQTRLNACEEQLKAKEEPKTLEEWAREHNFKHWPEPGTDSDK